MFNVCKNKHLKSHFNLVCSKLYTFVFALLIQKLIFVFGNKNKN